MNFTDFIKRKVAFYYWQHNINCAETSLKVLSEFFQLPLNEQVINSVLSLPGAGQCGGQCGIVGATLMFMGILGREYGINDDEIKKFCKTYSKQYAKDPRDLNQITRLIFVSL